MKKLLTLSLLLSNSLYAQFQLESVVHNQDVSIKKDLIENDEKVIIDSESIDQTQASSVDDIFQESVEATTARGPRSSSQAIQVRGLDSNKILIMVDGVRQNYREGHSAMNPIDLENLKKVEIYTNSSDFSKGGSLGGGVQFITKDPSDYLQNGQKSGQEYKFQTSTVDFENRINAKSIFIEKDISGLISLTNAKANNLKLNDNSTLDNSAYEDFSALIKLNFDNVSFSYEHYKREDNSPLDPSLNPPEILQDLLADSILTKNTYLLSYDNKKNNLKFYVNDYTTNKAVRLNSIEQVRKIKTSGLSYVGKSKNFLYGFESYIDELDSDLNNKKIVNYPKASSINTNVFLEKEFTFAKYKIVPGLRFSTYELDNNKEIKSASALSKKLYQEFEIVDGAEIFLSYSEGFNAPKVMEVFPSGLHSPGDDFIVRDNNFIPNLDLAHESSAIKEIGFKFKRSYSYLDKLSFSTSIYENDVDNYINIQRIDKSVMDPEDGTSQFVNISKVHINGLEAKINYLYDIYDFGISYSKIRGKNISENLYLEDLPADQYVYTFKVYLDKSSFGYSAIQALEQNRVNPQTLQRTEKTPGYFIHNIFGNIKLDKNFELGARINNLGNKEYRRHASHINEAAQEIRLLIQYKINTI